MSADIGEYKYGKFTIVLVVVMLLSIPAAIVFHPFTKIKGYNVSIRSDKIVEKKSCNCSNAKKYKTHVVEFEYSGHPEDEERYYSVSNEYDLDSRSDMDRYKILKEDKIYWGTAGWRICIYVLLWLYTVISFFWSISEAWGEELTRSALDEVLEQYCKQSAKLLQFLGYNKDKITACKDEVYSEIIACCKNGYGDVKRNPTRREVLKLMKQKVLANDNKQS